MSEIEEKQAFAELLLKTPNEPFVAALKLFPENTPRALRIATEWPKDPEVIAAINALNANGGDLAMLPGKAELCRDIWQRMQGVTLSNGLTVPPTADEYAKLAKLYAEVRAFIEKPSTNINVPINVQRVVEVPVFSSPDEWERAAAAQQHELLANARTRH